MRVAIGAERAEFVFPSRPPLLTSNDLVILLILAAAVCVGEVAARAIWWGVLTWTLP